MRALSSQMCFSMIVDVIALAHQRNKKHPCYRSTSELYKNTIPRKNQRSDSTFTSTKKKTGSGIKTFAPALKFFYLSFFLTTNHPPS